MSRGAALGDLPPKPTAFELGPNTPSALFSGMICPWRPVRRRDLVPGKRTSPRRRVREAFSGNDLDWRALAWRAALPPCRSRRFAYGDGGEAGDLRGAGANARAAPDS